MKIGITGSGGFIGKHLKEELSKENEIEEFDHSTGLDILNSKHLEKFVKDKDCIIHLAGLNKGNNSDLYKINVLGTQKLLEAIKEHNKEVRLIFSSSFQVYEPKDEDKKRKEEEINAKTEYGLSKYLSEKIIEFYAKNYGIKSTILRFSNVYGPLCKPNYNSVISTFIYKIKNNEELTVNDLEAKRDYIYIKDVVNAIIKSMNHNENFSVFNICSGEVNSLKEILDILSQFKEFKIENRNNKENGYIIGDYEKAKKYLNFNPEINIKEGLKNTWESFK